MTAEHSTVFGDLCAAYDEAHEEVETYLETYGRWIGSLIMGLKDYLQCPTDRIIYFDRTGERTSLREAMYLEGGAWHLQIGICMHKEGGVKRMTASPSGSYYPSQTVLMTLAVRGMAESFTTKLDPYDDEFIISKATEESDRKAFYGFLAEKIKAHYKNMLRSIVEHGKVMTILSRI
jgi:hypothetical protein